VPVLPGEYTRKGEAVKARAERRWTGLTEFLGFTGFLVGLCPGLACRTQGGGVLHHYTSVFVCAIGSFLRNNIGEGMESLKIKGAEVPLSADGGGREKASARAGRGAGHGGSSPVIEPRKGRMRAGRSGRTSLTESKTYWLGWFPTRRPQGRLARWRYVSRLFSGSVIALQVMPDTARTISHFLLLTHLVALLRGL
jgi:hypothetical protein